MPSKSPFVFPVKVLESDRIRMVPYESSVHADSFAAAVVPTPHIFRYLPYGPFNNANEITKWYEGRIGGTSAEYLWAVYVKDGYGKNEEKKEEMAGVVGLLYAAPEVESVEIGFITTFTPHQRTFVTTHAIALLMFYCLDRPDPLTFDPCAPTSTPHTAPPASDPVFHRSIQTSSPDQEPRVAESGGGLGLRRVQWQAHHLNAPSINAAKRLGMQWEGIVRWQRGLPPGKEGHANERDCSEVRRLKGGVDRGNMQEGRHSAVLSTCWDDWWERGEREKVFNLMARP